MSSVATSPIDGFDGTTTGRTYTATADGQFIRVFANATAKRPSSGMFSATLSDMSDGVTPTDHVTVRDGAVTFDPKAGDWWYEGLNLSKDAHVTIPCRGYFTDADWRIMRTLGVDCFDKDTAAY